MSNESQPIANRVGMIFVDRRLRQLQGPQLLQGLAKEMLRVKRWRLGQTSAKLLWVARFLPGGIQNFLVSRACWATAVLSNLGQPFGSRDAPPIKFGASVVENVFFVTPIRDKTSVAMGVVTFGGRLNLTLHYDPSVISLSHAEKLLDDFQTRLIKHSLDLRKPNAHRHAVPSNHLQPWKKTARKN
jgi:hypothetical protein